MKKAEGRKEREENIMKKIGLFEIIAEKNTMILAHDNYYNNYFFGTPEQLKSLNCPINQIGTLKEIKAELARWKNGVDKNNSYMLEIENCFLEVLKNL